jgi:hypothetical protein
MASAQIDESRIGRYREGIFGQTEMPVIHRASNSSTQ